MSANLYELVAHCDELLQVSSFKDYCPNGLQIEGRSELKRIVTGVTASQALIDAAIDQKADAILVHHGYFWRGEDPVLTKIKGRRIKSLMQHDISLIAYHLPLDAHPQLGNNAQLAKLLNFSVDKGLDDSPNPIGFVGRWRAEGARHLDALSEHIAKQLSRQPLVIGNAQQEIESVAWCTGAAQSMIESASLQGVDCFISGEISEQTVHLANELGIAYISAGHHATERYGAKALGEYLRQNFAVDVEFIDIANPV